jgi:hypothetical protein
VIQSRARFSSAVQCGISNLGFRDVDVTTLCFLILSPEDPIILDVDAVFASEELALVGKAACEQSEMSLA